MVYTDNNLENNAQRINSNMSHKERIQQARRHLIDSFIPLLKPENTKNIRWIGTKTDLLEMIHIVYMSAEVKDDEGRPATFLWLVRRIFSNLRLTVPRNPSALVCKSVVRKNVRQSPLLERYCWLLFEKGEEYPLKMWIAVCN